MDTTAGELRSRAWKILPVAFLFLAPLILYSGTLHYPLVFDDVVLQEKNQQVFGRMWRHFELRWLSYGSFGWTHELVGTGLAWQRLGNIVLHALTSVALFALLRRLFGAVLGPPVFAKGAVELTPAQLAFFSAMLFALHPFAVYGVAYLVERSIVMATLFSLLSLHAYLEGLLRGGRRWFVAAAALYLLAVFSKEHCVMLPGVAAALTLLLRKPSWSLLRELWLPFAMFLFVGLLIVLKSKGLLGAPYEPAAAKALAHLSESRQIPQTEGIYFLSVITQCWLFFKYLFLWLVPNPAWLAVDLRQKLAGGFLSWPETAGGVAFVAYGLFAVWLLLKGGRRGLAGFGLLFPWLFYLTELSAVRIQEPFVIYRAYLWMGGWAAVVPLLIPRIGARWKAVLLGVICLALIPLTMNRLDSFSSAWKLWDDVVRKNPDKTLFYAERGYYKRGIASIELGNYPDAIRDFTTCLEINSGNADIYLNRGMASMQSGKYPEALKDFEAGLALNPKDPNLYVNRGIIYAVNRSYDGAIADFGRALQLDADNAAAYFNRGLALRLASRNAEGSADIRKSCGLGHAPACRALATP